MAYTSPITSPIINKLKCPNCGEQIEVIEFQDKVDGKFECPKCGEVKSAIIEN